MSGTKRQDSEYGQGAGRGGKEGMQARAYTAHVHWLLRHCHCLPREVKIKGATVGC